MSNLHSEYHGPIGVRPGTNSGKLPPGGEGGMGVKVRVYIGSEPKTEIARKVLQCSINRRTNADVEYVVMMGKEWEYDHSKFHVGTGFSLRRWMIPAHAGAPALVPPTSSHHPCPEVFSGGIT